MFNIQKATVITHSPKSEIYISQDNRVFCGGIHIVMTNDCECLITSATLYIGDLKSHIRMVGCDMSHYTPKYYTQQRFPLSCDKDNLEITLYCGIANQLEIPSDCVIDNKISIAKLNEYNNEIIIECEDGDLDIRTCMIFDITNKIVAKNIQNIIL